MNRQLIMPPKQEQQFPVHPLKFILWLIIVSSGMLFAGFTSAFIVKKADGKAWLNFALPDMFMISSVIIIISSITMWYAYHSAKKDEIKQLRLSIIATLLLGVSFVIVQYLGWKDMVSNGIHFVDYSVSASFVYVISGVHLAHIIGGLIFLGVVLYKSFQFQIHKKNMLTISLCSTYWHFVGVLWIYLYMFMVNA